MPESAGIGKGHQLLDIQVALQYISGGEDSCFSHFIIIEGAPRSGRILFRNPVKGSESFPRALSPEDMTCELLRLRDEIGGARYDPVKNYDRNKKKGWEIRAARIQGQLCAIAWATWV